MEIFQHPIQICHQIILRLHSSSHTREKVSINLTMKKSLSRQRRRASTQQKAAIREKPQRCTECEFSSIRAAELKTHVMSMHTGEKPYKCNQCNYSCAQSCHLQRHMRTHSGEKPFQCNQCSKAYTDKRNLTNHLKIHMT